MVIINNGDNKQEDESLISKAVNGVKSFGKKWWNFAKTINPFWLK